MRIYNDCISCILKGALDAARLSTDDESVHRRILNTTMERLISADYHEPPPVIAGNTQRLIRDATGNPDPYKMLKQRYNDFALEIYPELETMVRESSSPFEKAVNIAIAGNIIDFGAFPDIGGKEIVHTIEQAASSGINGNLSWFESAVERADRILWLADNTGEIVLDKLLLGRMDRSKVVYAVRGAPILNDATLEDAVYTGMTDVVEVIENGAELPGTLIEKCSERFREEYERADLIVSKGQGNYETLSHDDRRIVFLFKVKCHVVARESGKLEGESAILQHGGIPARTVPVR
ncbi:MAG: ARMT1-like domain-containing protein [Desulfarculaceae bacterium]|nr:ARMT1-like domain-containing protein [Desulfarculaceae bacterium]